MIYKVNKSAIILVDDYGNKNPKDLQINYYKLSLTRLRLQDQYKNVVFLSEILGQNSKDIGINTWTYAHEYKYEIIRDT